MNEYTIRIEMPQLQIITDILVERKRQDDKWGAQQNQDDSRWATILGEEFGEVCQAVLKYTNLREELVQVAAVAIAWIEDLDWQKESE